VLDQLSGIRAAVARVVAGCLASERRRHRIYGSVLRQDWSL
jgi:hypothetical protein